MEPLSILSLIVNLSALIEPQKEIESKENFTKFSSTLEAKQHIFSKTPLKLEKSYFTTIEEFKTAMTFDNK